MADVKFTESGAKRIIMATRFVEGQYRNAPPVRYLHEGSPGRERWFSLAERLDAGLTASAYAVEWNETGDGAYTVKDASGDEVYEVRDPSSQHWGLKHEWVLCRAVGSKNRIVYEVIQGGAEVHMATLRERLIPGGSAMATVVIRGHEVPVTVWNHYLSARETLDSGVGVIITYIPEDRKWYVKNFAILSTPLFLIVSAKHAFTQMDSVFQGRVIWRPAWTLDPDPEDVGLWIVNFANMFFGDAGSPWFCVRQSPEDAYIAIQGPCHYLFST